MAFKKGKSGNPKGRTPGKTPATQLKKVIADNMPDILQAMIKQAMAGDTAAAKALIDKVIPSLKTQALPVSINSEPGLAAKGEAVIDNTLNGNIPPDIGAALITALTNQAKLTELDELTKRIESLERNNG